MRTLRLPPADLSKRAVPLTRQSAGCWLRIHAAGVSPIDFSLKGYHRFSHSACKHQILYLGGAVQTCLWERFGDVVLDNLHVVPRSLWMSAYVSEIRLPALKVCDLTKVRTRAVLMVDLTALMSHELAVPQAWSLAIQQHPAGFEAIRFLSRWNQLPCLALFNQANLKLKTKLTSPLVGSREAANWIERHKISLV